MKKLSSDIAFYITLVQTLIGPIFIVSFLIFGGFAPSTVVYIISAILIILSIYNLIRLVKKCKVFYAEEKFIAYSYFSPSTAIEIPFNDVIDITQKSTIKSMRNINNMFSIIYNDGGRTKKLSFLSSTMTSIYQLKKLISDDRQYVKPIAPVNNIIGKKIDTINIYQQLDAGKRFAAATTDWFIMTLIAMPFAIPVIVYNISNKSPDKPGGPLWYIALIGFAIFFCKDCIQGRSIAKRLLNQQVVNKKTGQIANPLRCFVRDIFMIVWPIEGIATLISPQRRLGDIVAGTKVIVFDPELEMPPINYLQIAASFVLAYATIFLVTAFT